MLSIVDLRDFLEISRALYRGGPVNDAAAQAQALDALLRVLATQQSSPQADLAPQALRQAAGLARR